MPSRVNSATSSIFSAQEPTPFRPTENPFFHDKINNSCRPYLQVQRETSEAPQLVPPSEYNPTPLSKNLIRMLDTITQVALTQKGCANDVVDSLEGTIVTQQQEALKTSQSEREYVDDTGWADFFKKIAVCSLSAFSIVLGGKMIFDNPGSVEHLIGGGAMIVSAISSLIGSIMIDSNDSPQAATFLTLVSMGFGLIGGTAYLNLSGNSLADIATRLGMASLAIVSSTAELGKQYSHFQIEELKGAQALIQELLARCRNISEQQTGYETMSTQTTISTMSTYSEAAMTLERAKKVILANMIGSHSA